MEGIRALSAHVIHGARAPEIPLEDTGTFGTFKNREVRLITRQCRRGFDMSTSAATIVALTLALGVAGGARAQGGKPAARGTLAQMAWLAGIWAGAAGPATFEERWTPPAGGAMLAVSRTLKGDRMVAFEFLRIVERNEGLVYIAQPNGRPPTEFTLTNITADSATFENPSHDFPKMIRYTRRADGSLEARVSDGGQKGETFLFKRSP
jgi:hypothetical protein